MLEGLPVLGVCGWSGSGKTTAIEGVLPGLLARGLKVAVVKHDAHGLDLDRRGKDSYRLFRAGADVSLQGPEEGLLRTHESQGAGIETVLRRLAGRYDLVLVEGHKGTPLPKVWLLGEGEAAPPPEVSGVLGALPRDAERVERLAAVIDEWLPRQWLKAPVYGCALIGGSSRRMGRPKHLIAENGETWLERTVGLLRRVTARVVISGAGEVPESLAGSPRLVDAPGAEGPLSGLLSAMRWAPGCSWLVAACDLPELSSGALEWLLAGRAPGVWATLPRLAGSERLEPLLAHYDFRARRLIESLAARRVWRLAEIAADPKVTAPSPPPELAPAWRNANSPEDLG